MSQRAPPQPLQGVLRCSQAGQNARYTGADFPAVIVGELGNIVSGGLGLELSEQIDRDAA